MIRNRETREGRESHIALGAGAGTRESDGNFEVPAGKTELIPTLEHATLVLESVCLLVLHLDPKSATSGGDLPRVIPFLVSGSPVPQVDSFPVGIVAGVESATIGVKLVREDKDVFLSIPSGPCLGSLRGITVNQTSHLEVLPWLTYTLIRTVDACVAVQALPPSVLLIVANDGIADEEGEEGENQYGEGSDV